LSNVEVDATAMLGDSAGNTVYQDVVDRARIGWCALATGAAQAVLDYVIEYCNGRIAFGEPITNRQAVAFMIADIAIELESMRLLMLRAASRAEQGLPFHRETYLARLFSAQRAAEIGTNGVQLLGGHGYVKEHPVERWYRDLTAVGLMEGGFVV
jgi:alkylation response protein AidB-like acyl-CoA dehydrogenase